MPNVFRELAHALAALTTNCQEFHERWEKAGSRSGQAHRWRGEWRSEENGHHGPIDCVLEPADQGQMRAFFHAEYSKVLRVCYAVSLAAARTESGYHLKGEADLGKLAGGIYTYEGELNEARFLCTYRCRYDHGVFDLTPSRE